MNTNTMFAVFKRDFSGYFATALGYLIVIAFVVVTAFAQFGGDDFFNENKANLDQLSFWMPRILVLFAPAIAMASWAGEYRQGTEELLFTLPARDGEIVVAKYLANLAVYTVALLLTFTFVLALGYLGEPDGGLLAATYFGYWLLGGTLIAVAMVASALTSNQTVAFVLGALLTLSLAAFSWLVESAYPGFSGDAIARLGVTARYEPFTRGVVALEDVTYFLALTGAALYANTLIVGQRHWTSGQLREVHGLLRLVSLLVAGICLTLLSQRAVARIDTTSAGLTSLSPEAEEVIAEIATDQPVLIQAWISPEVPDDFVPVRDEVLSQLREFDARGGDKVRTVIYQCDLYSDLAQRAQEDFGITSRKLTTQVDGRLAQAEFLFGLAFTSGPRVETIPFFEKGLPVQFELTRAVGVVSKAERSKLGVLRTGAKLFGGFDFQTMGQTRDWEIVRELRRQYEVEQVDGTAAISTDLDVLLVPMPSSMPQGKIDRLAEYLWNGGKAVILCDPFPLWNVGQGMNLAPKRPISTANPFQQQRGPQPEPKGKIEPLLEALGVEWPKDRIVWDDVNPHPDIPVEILPREVVFVVDERPGVKGDQTGFAEDEVTRGLQEVALPFPGYLEERELPDIEFKPLLYTRPASGTHRWEDMVSESFMGVQIKPFELLRHAVDDERKVLAARLKGRMVGTTNGDAMVQGQLSSNTFEAIVIADADLISDTIYQLRRQGDERFNLDNVEFISSAIDSLAGEQGYLALRKRRPKQRSLTRLEAIEERLQAKVRETAEKAEEDAEKELEKAQERLDEAVAAVDKRTDLDPRTKEIIKEQILRREQSRLEAEKERIESEKKSKVQQARTEAARQKQAEQNRIRGLVIAPSPLPALVLALVVFLVMRTREAAETSAARRR